MSTIASPPAPSALTSLISSSGSSDPISALTTQIVHNLQHQHLWTSLQVHHVPSTTDQDASTPLISGIPPNRLYTHPDEQLWMLENDLRDTDIGPERFFVLPTTRGQKFSLRKLAGVFDSLPEVEDEQYRIQLETDDQNGKNKAEKLVAYYERREQAQKTKEWGGKKLLLAMVDRGIGGDGTVVYYVVLEGTVKPRQN